MTTMPLPSQCTLHQDGSYIRLTWQDGTAARFHAIWLRDNAPDPQTRSHENGQKLIRLQDISTTLHIDSADLKNQSIRINFMPERLTITFDTDWLYQHRYDRISKREACWLDPGIKTWDCKQQDDILNADYSTLSSDSLALKQWLFEIKQKGFAMVSKAGQSSGDLKKIIDLFGFIRETNYGLWFDVKAEIKPENLAYSSLGLQAHTDNPYRDPQPTLQLLHCLENNAIGGESIIVDGFKAAQLLQQEAPTHFNLLSQQMARFSYQGSHNVKLNTKHPMIELSPEGELISIRFNNRSTSTLLDIPFDLMADYYQAYRHFGDIIERPEMAIQFKLTPGQGFIVDNTRVLHSRTAFSGQGNRWLQGCYADKDSLYSTLATLS